MRFVDGGTEETANSLIRCNSVSGAARSFKRQKNCCMKSGSPARIFDANVPKTSVVVLSNYYSDFEFRSKRWASTLFFEEIPKTYSRLDRSRFIRINMESKIFEDYGKQPVIDITGSIIVMLIKASARITS